MKIEAIEKFENEIVEQICLAQIPPDLAQTLTNQLMLCINNWCKANGINALEYRRFLLHLSP